MFDYERFKAAAYKFKYETAFEYLKNRVSYSDFLNLVNAFYNSLCQMGHRGNILLLSRDAFTVSTVSLAASKAGVACIHADSKILQDDVAFLCKKYMPSLVIFPLEQKPALCEVLLQQGIQSAIITDGVDTPSFPKEFYFDDLLVLNNYLTKLPDFEKCPQQLFFDNTYLCTVPEIDNLPLRDGIFIDCPAFTPAFAQTMSKLLYSGRKYTAAPKKIKTVLHISDDLEKQLGIVAVDGGLFYSDRLSKKLSQLCKHEINCTVENGKIRVIVKLFENESTSSITDSQLVKTLKLESTRLFMPYNVPKTFVFKPKIN